MDALRFRPGDLAVVRNGLTDAHQNDGIMVRIEGTSYICGPNAGCTPGLYWPCVSLGKPLYRKEGHRRQRHLGIHDAVLHKLVSAPAPAHEIAQSKPRGRRARAPATAEAS